MPRTAKLSKGAICEHLMPVFELYGYEGASLKMLADAAGLSKASLYHHFPKGKEDMASHVLGQAGVRLQAMVLAPLETTMPGADRLAASLDGVADYYQGQIPVCLMNSFLLGGGVGLFGGQIKKVVTVWQRGFVAAYESAGADRIEARAWGVYAVERIQGALVLCRVQGSRKPLEACLDELRTDVSFLGE